MAELVHLQNTSTAEDIIEVLNNDAGVIIDGLIDQKEVNLLNKDLAPYLKNDVFGRMNSLDLKQKESVPLSQDLKLVET